VTPELIDMIRQTRNVDVLVHGWRHRSYSLSSEKKSEFPQSRSLPDMVEDAQRALAAMKFAFPDHCLPVLVPPWNSIGSSLLDQLHGIGYCGLSCRSSDAPTLLRPRQGLVQADRHLDPMKHNEDKGRLADVALMENRLGGQLQRGAPGPACIVSHHLDFTPETWAYVEELLSMLANHPAVSFVRARDIFFPDDSDSQIAAAFSQ
jgi:hypothetical protein